MRYVLNRPAQEKFCSSIINNIPSEDPEVEEMINGCKYFYFEIHGNTYFLSKDIEKKIKSGSLNQKYIANVYSISEEFNFYIESFNSEFVEFLLQESSRKGVELDDEIAEIQESYLGRYGY